MATKKKSATAAKAAAPTVKVGQQVVWRSEESYNDNREHPATITRVFSNDQVNLHVLEDMRGARTVGSAMRIDPASDAAPGWYVPA